ncbi:glycosyltransferase [Bradyrhizobium sp. UNPF46]|uniref:glycosyltransferase n=1 Tax=Bradyrhizobium sp. UNPF46 TaxID=1141168 RepID=UPI001AED8A41|nr:glycosyltransferase [Bradyrhizobium sp. UNPF46]
MRHSRWQPRRRDRHNSTPRKPERAIRFAIAVHGTRGDIEPATAVARELQRRGHDVRMAVPPNLVGFAELAGLGSVSSYGPDSQRQLEAEVFHDWFELRNPVKVLRQAREYLVEGWTDMSATLTRLAAGADVILSGTTYQELAANVAEAQGVPLAALHYFPVRANNHILPFRLPQSLVAPLWSVAEWLHWRLLRPAYDEQRRALGLPHSRIRAVRQIVESGALEIQAYDKVFFPGLEAQWGWKRPLVGTMALESATCFDDSVNSWIGAGRRPIYFGFGSMPVDRPAETVEMIANACRELGERALICSGILPLEGTAPTRDVMIVPSVNHATVLPRCRAIVHHGGSGTTAASVRSGVPTLVLWIGADQPVWATQIKRLGVGTSRRFTATTAETLRHDLRTVLAPGCATRAREVANQMTPPSRSLTATVALLEELAAMRA